MCGKFQENPARQGQDRDDFLMSWPPWPKKAKTWSRQVGLSSNFSQTICWWVSSNACICNLISGLTVKLSQISARRCFTWSEQLDLKSIMPKNQKSKTHVAAEHTSYHLYWSTTDFGAKFYIGVDLSHYPSVGYGLLVIFRFQ